jgi:hypothetical protein
LHVAALFISALLQILQQLQKSLGDGFARHLIEYRSELPADMALESWR